MLVIPAIDVLDGAAVRLLQGRYDRVLRAELGPLQMARRFADQGAPWIHVIDLDGARAGRWRNLELIGRIAAEVGARVQAGGGARSREEIRAALEAGVSRVIISTAALGDPDDFRALAAEFGPSLVVGLDARGRHLLVRGWEVDTHLELGSAARSLVAHGACRLLYTDTQRDGMLSGVDAEVVGELVRLRVPLMVAGGVREPADLVRLRQAGAEAAIVGRALLEGTLDLAEALALHA